MSGTTRLLLIRHAESTWNASGRWQGQADPPLSELGREQARALASRFEGESVARLFTSDLGRARETAARVAPVLALEPTADGRLRELDVGSWTGLTRAEIQRKDAETLVLFEAEAPDVRPGGGETRREIRSRVRAAVEDLADTHPGETLALVVHLGVIRALVPGSLPDHTDVVTTTLAEVRTHSQARERE